MDDNAFFTRIDGKFCCKLCNTYCVRKTEWTRHIATRKHINKANVCEKSTLYNAKPYVCHCKREFNDRSGLWRHKHKCSGEKQNKKTQDDKVIEPKSIDVNLIMFLIEQNKDLKELLIEQNNKIMELAKEKSLTINNTTNNNQSFNMNFFLNEQCKDALDIMDFVNSLQLSLSDLENTGKVGYVKGISDIFLRGLRELDVYKRPIHCSDLKREVLYVKDNDIWEKDEDNKKVKKAIQHIGGRNFKQIKEWTDLHPDSKDVRTKKHEQYVGILLKCTGGADKEEDDALFNKIITNVAKEVTIDK
jgi:hypothetical protein